MLKNFLISLNRFQFILKLYTLRAFMCTEECEDRSLDPEGQYPDVNFDNNSFTKPIYFINYVYTNMPTNNNSYCKTTKKENSLRNKCQR